MRGQYGRVESFREGTGLTTTSVGLKDRYGKLEYKTYESSIPKYPTSGFDSYYSKPISSALSSYSKSPFDYKSVVYSTPPKTPFVNSSLTVEDKPPKTEYKNSFSNYSFQKATYNSITSKPPIYTSSEQTKCLTNRDPGQQPTDLGRKVPLKPSSSISLPGYESAAYSTNSNGTVEAYATNTNKGLVRYN